MERMRSRTSNLFYASGVLHLVYVLFLLFLLFRPIDSTLVITTIFGIAYLVIGYYLVRGGMTIILVGGIAAVIGGLLSIAGMILQFHWFSIIFLLFDVVMVYNCVVIYTRTRRALRAI